MANRRYIDFPIASTSGDTDIILIWQDGVNKQTTKATFLSGLPENLDELNDVAISGLTNGQILRYDSTTGKWENTDQGNLDLNDLNDVSIVSPSNGQVLVYNSSTSKWENSSGGFVPYTGAVTTVNLGAQTIQAGQFVKAGGTSSQFLKADGSIDSTAYGTGSVTSVGLTMPSAFSVANSPVTTAGTLAVTGAGTVSQYIRGDGSLADFPESSGGGSSVSYYLNGSVNQGTIGGVAYRELSKIPVLGAGTDFSINANGYVASFITDAGDPSLLEIPGGNWNFETYFSASSGGGSPTFYVELYKVSGTTATLIASNSGSPELIAFGTTLTSYFSTLAVPTTTLALTDRLAIRYYVTHSGRTITLHTEDNHLCQIITTFTTGLTALNGLTAQVQNFATGTIGTDFNIASASATHTFNLPTASGTNRGALSAADWTTFNNKENAITAGTTAQYFRGDKTFQTLNTSVVPELTNLYYTEARVNANANVAANTAARHNAVTLGTANGLSLSTQVLSLGLASAGVTGALSGTDWTTFNSKQNALTNPVTGTGASGQVAFFTGTTTISSESNLFWNQTDNLLGIGTNSPQRGIHISGTGAVAEFLLSNTNFISGTRNFNIWANTNNGFWELRTLADNFNSTGVIFANLAPLTGNILINKTSDSGEKLQIIGGASTALRLESNSNVPALSIGGTGDLVVDAPGVIGGRFFVNNSGNVGIGKNSPSEKLHVVTSIRVEGSTPAFNLYESTSYRGNLQWQTTAGSVGIRLFNIDNSNLMFGTTGTEKMRLTEPGNLLIGTTTDNGARLQVSGAATVSSSVTASRFISSTSSSYTNDFLNLNIGTVGQTIGLRFGYDGSTYNKGAIYFISKSANGVGDLIFAANNSESSANVSTSDERMRITSSGNVGIGSNPGYKLNVFDAGVAISSGQANWSTNTRGLMIDNTNNGDESVGVWFRTGNNHLSGISGQRTNSASDWSTDLRFYTHPTSTTNLTLAFERLRITSEGNVLIGSTTDNGSRLQVNGAIRTAQPVGTTSNGWLLGRALVSGTSTPDRWIRVQIGLEYYDILAVYMGTL